MVRISVQPGAVNFSGSAILSVVPAVRWLTWKLNVEGTARSQLLVPIGTCKR